MVTKGTGLLVVRKVGQQSEAVQVALPFQYGGSRLHASPIAVTTFRWSCECVKSSSVRMNTISKFTREKFLCFLCRMTSKQHTKRISETDLLIQLMCCHTDTGVSD